MRYFILLVNLIIVFLTQSECAFVTFKDFHFHPTFGFGDLENVFYALGVTAIDATFFMGMTGLCMSGRWADSPLANSAIGLGIGIATSAGVCIMRHYLLDTYVRAKGTGIPGALQSKNAPGNGDKEAEGFVLVGASKEGAPAEGPKDAAKQVRVRHFST